MRRLLLCFGFLFILAAGCSALTKLPQPYPKAGAASRQFPKPDDGYVDHPGVIHIHTTYSHDAQGTFDEVVQAANAQRLDYVILTEHNTLQPLRDGKQGWHGAVLVLVGMEISTRSGHYVALNVTQEMDRAGRTAQQIIDAVKAQGGLGFIAHPYFKHARWTDWGVSGFTGVEAYNVAHDTLDENKLRLALWSLSAPASPFFFSILDRPYDPLAKWDELIAARGPVVGIGASDAHEFKAFGVTFAPYDVMFRMARTHVLTRSQTLTAEAVYDALRAGHAYVGIELAAEAEGFAYFAETDGGIAGIMGDQVSFQPGMRLVVSTPAVAFLAIYRDGRPIQSTIGSRWIVPVTQPGAYRIEASRHNKPWILSNPIYVRPAPATPPG